jgi:ElaB/YqjD/DUF883 family membrane-anchored ribosome-binding protein
MNGATQQLQEICEKATHTLSHVTGKTEVLAQSARRNARETARAVSEYVHRSPWTFIGAAALVAAAIGYFLRRR